MQGLKPLLVAKYSQLYQLCLANGITIKFTEGLRSIAEQNALFAKGRSAAGNVIDSSLIVTNAKGGQSMHNYGVAFDVVVVVGGVEDWDMHYPALWTKMGKLGESIGLEWGGDWAGTLQDHPHFQITFGHTWQDFENGKVDYSMYKEPQLTTIPAPTPAVAPVTTTSNNQSNAPVQTVGVATPIPANIQAVIDHEPTSILKAWFLYFYNKFK